MNKNLYFGVNYSRKVTMAHWDNLVTLITQSQAPRFKRSAACFKGLAPCFKCSATCFKGLVPSFKNAAACFKRGPGPLKHVADSSKHQAPCWKRPTACFKRRAGPLKHAAGRYKNPAPSFKNLVLKIISLAMGHNIMVCAVRFHVQNFRPHVSDLLSVGLPKGVLSNRPCPCVHVSVCPSLNISETAH